MFLRNVDTQVDDLEPGTAEHDRNKVFSYIVQVTLNGAQDNGAYTPFFHDSVFFFQNVEPLSYTAGSSQYFGDIGIILFIIFPHGLHGRHHGLLNDDGRIYMFLQSSEHKKLGITRMPVFNCLTKFF